MPGAGRQGCDGLNNITGSSKAPDHSGLVGLGSDLFTLLMFSENKKPEFLAKIS